MAIVTEDDLLTSVRDWLARAGDTTTLPDNAIQLALSFCEADVNARLRVPAMEGSSALSITAQTVDLPADFSEVRRLYIDTAPGLELEYLSPAAFWAKFNMQPTGIPLFYTIELGQIVLGPDPGTSTYTGRLLYWKNLPALGSGTNAVLVAHQDLYLYGTLAHMAGYIGTDDRISLWRAAYEAALARAQQAGDRAGYGGSSLTIRAA